MEHPTYRDYNATTPVDPAVLDTMFPYLRTHFGNPRVITCTDIGRVTQLRLHGAARCVAGGAPGTT